MSEDKIIELLKGRELTINEIARELGYTMDLKTLRSLLSELVRRGVVERKPSYEKKKMVFTLATVKPSEKKARVE